MTKSLTAALISLAAFLFFTIRCAVHFDFNLMVWVIISAIMLICSGVCLVFARLNLPMSLHLLFAIADVLTGVGVLIVSLWCIFANSNGGFTDVIGWLILLFVMPVVVIAFVVNMAIWKTKQENK